MKRPRGTVLVIVAGMLLAGCGGPATFVSTDPPPDAVAEAWYVSPVARVRSALKQAMVQSGIAIDAEGSTQTRLIGTKPQLPHVDDESGGPVSGRLPVYVVELAISRPRDTHVQARLTTDTRGGSTTSVYDWEYPDDLLKRVFVETGKTLNERHVRYVLPPRPARRAVRRPPPRR